MKHTRFRPYLIIPGIVVLGLIVLLLSRFNLIVQVEPTSSPQPDPAISPFPELPRPPSLEPSPSVAVTTPTPTPTPQATQDASQRQGRLRVSNQTEHPIRVALLYQSSQESAQANEALQSSNPSYGEPVHWDFAPNEGSTKGLLLSLPNTDLKLHPGDVLVAFAQDGSRRYWGPYVLGETATPRWSAADAEWQLILQPE